MDAEPAPEIIGVANGVEHVGIEPLANRREGGVLPEARTAVHATDWEGI